MKTTTSASALLLLAASVAASNHDARHEHLQTLYRKHHAHRDVHKSAMERGEGVEMRAVSPEGGVERRDGQCTFPTDAGLVSVTPDQENAGWAMSPNQPCLPGNYCPYACPPGQVSMQWDPDATSYTYPLSMNGGLYCDETGTISKPFPSKPYCQDSTTTIGATNNAGDVVAFCQTVLPGNEAMLIPTAVESWVQLAVPDTSYWCGTAAHYYINPPGTSVDEACVWGTSSNPFGNWSPYVAGANTDGNGNTFVKLGWNPIYLEPATPFRNTMPNWGVSIECDGSGCNGLPCAIDPSQNGVNEMVGSSSDGAGGGAFCVVTVPKGVNANFVVSGPGSSSSASSSSWPSSAQGGQFYQSSTSSTSSASTTTTESHWSSTESSSATWTHWSSSTSSTYSANSTTHTWTPTASPYYSLFNGSATVAPTTASAVESSEATLTASYSAPSGVATLPSKGSGSTKEVSITVAVLAALAALSF